MNTDIEKVMIKIKKLLAMAEHKTSNPNEAARAATMAAKMMSEYQLERADIIKAELNEGGGLTDDNISDQSYIKWPVWMQGLAISTARLFECQVKFKRVEGTRKKILRVMGYEADVQMVKWMFDFIYTDLNRQAVRAMKESTSGAHGGHVKASFLQGAATTIKSRFATIIDERMKEYASDCTSLMVVKSKAVEEKYGMSKYRNRLGSRVDYTAFSAGQQAGNKLNINRPLGTAAAQRMLK